MRKIEKQKNTKRNILLIIIAALIAVGSVYVLKNSELSFFGMNAQEPAPENNIDYNEATNDQKAAGEVQKKVTSPTNRDTKPEPEDESDDTTGENSFKISITALNVTDSVVQVRSIIDTVSSSGVCTLELSNGNETIMKKSGLQAGPKSSTCQGFDIPTSELSSGEWKITITANIDGHESNTSQSFSV